MNSYGQGESSDSLTVALNDLPETPTKPSGENNLCLNPSNTDYTITETLGSSSYVWSISPESAGTISGNGLTGTVDWIDDFTGEVKVSVIGQNDCGQSESSDSLTVVINGLPETPTKLTGESNLCLNPTNSDYTITETLGSTSYIWSISPESAGTISGNGLTGTIDWTDDFTGVAKISVIGQNDCGQGNSSDSLIVNITDCTTNLVSLSEQKLNIYPNPSKGTVYFSSKSNNIISIKILDLQGKIISSFERIPENEINILHKGTFIIQLETTDEIITKKVMIY